MKHQNDIMINLRKRVLHFLRSSNRYDEGIAEGCSIDPLGPWENDTLQDNEPCKILCTSHDRIEGPQSPGDCIHTIEFFKLSFISKIVDQINIYELRYKDCRNVGQGRFVLKLLKKIFEN